MRYVAAYEGMTMRGPGYRAGVDPDGFFVLDPNTDPPETLFRSTRFRQRIVDAQRVEFADAHGAVEVAMSPVGGTGHRPPIVGTEGQPPQRLRVKVRPRAGADFAYIVEPLRRLCRAAADSGNPVVWR
jgi:hypothetical protein